MKQTSTLDRTSLRARALEASRIREIAERGMRMPGAIALWFGEGAWSTPAPIVQAAIASLVAGNHMYQPNNGASALRAEICAYANRLYGCALTPDRVTVTQSGTQALALAAQLLVSPGDRIVAIEPGWPNIAGAFRLAGGAVAPVALAPRDGRWVLDLEALLGQLTPGTGAVVLNSPNNPTGWTMPGDEQRALLEHCRARGIWVVTDDVYARLYRHGRAAPSFLEIAHPEDLLISVNSFSKCWSMTGWRLGWLVAPAALEARIGQLTEFNTSCSPGFVQEAGVAALRDGEDSIAGLLAGLEEGYALAEERLTGFGRVEFIRPDGAFYCFFRVAGLTDSVEAALGILESTGVGLAPGAAFGPSGEGYLRLCYARPPELLDEAFDRLAPILGG